MEYVGADNTRHRPFMIHRALFGSVERFFAILVEHYAGAFPTWLAPVQAQVLPVRDDHEDYAESVVGRSGCGPGLPGRTWSAPTNRSGRGCARAKLEKIPTSWSSATTTWRPGPSGSMPGAKSAPIARRARRQDFVARPCEPRSTASRSPEPST